MRTLLAIATTLQVAAVIYCVLLLRRHRNAAMPWLCLLGALLSMLVWRIVVTTGVTPGPVFNTSIAIWGSVSAVLAMYFFAHEVTRRERAEIERDHLLTSERTARTDAERASRIKDDFMATLSHELRTPLAAILGWCALARRGELPADAARAIDTIERNARVQTRLVDDLLDATRMQAGTLELDLTPVPLDGPVLAALEGVKPSASAKELQLRYTCTGASPIVQGDARRLQQIASNLLVNAVKFTPEGMAVDVTVRGDGEHAELIVRDQGIGIEEAFMPHLFQRFRQAESGHARRHGGVGLGLSIVSRLVELHRGEVHAHSDGPGAGSTFVVRLPRHQSTRLGLHGEASVPPASAADAAASVEGLRAIVVDDEVDVREAVTGWLERAGVTVQSLDSGVSIEAAIREFRPDVLLLDIGMPGEDGYSLIRRVRRLPSADGGDVPAISLTAHVRDEDRRHAMNLGFQAHLAKPVNLTTLLATIGQLAAGRQRSGQPRQAAEARPAV